MILISSGSRISRWGGGVVSHWGAPTSNMGTFWQKRMRKQKNWILLGGWARAGGAPPGSANADDDQTIWALKIQFCPIRSVKAIFGKIWQI